MPKIFIYIGSLIGVLFIFFGIFHFFIFQKNNQPQSQINTIQEIKNQEEEKIEEINQETNNEEEIEELKENNNVRISIIMRIILFAVEVFIIFMFVKNIKDNYSMIKKEKISMKLFFFYVFSYSALKFSWFSIQFLIKEKSVFIVFFVIRIFMFYLNIHDIYLKCLKNKNEIVKE